MPRERLALGLYALGVPFDAAIVLLPGFVPGVPPLTVGALHMCGQGIGMLAVAAIWVPAGLPRGHLLVAVLAQHARTSLFARVMLGRCSLGLVLVAVALAGPSLVAVVYGAWPVGWALVLRRASVDGQGHRYQQISAGAGVGLAAAFLGAALTVLAQPPQLRESMLLLSAGIAVVLVALLIDSQNSLSVTWGFMVAARVGAARCPGPESWAAIVGTGAAGLSAGLVFWVVASAVEGVSPVGHVMVCVAFGVVTGGIPSVLARLAMTRTTKTTVNSIGFVNPAVTVVYLAVLGWLDEVRVGYLLVGVALVMAGSAWSLRTRRLRLADTGVHDAHHLAE